MACGGAWLPSQPCDVMTNGPSSRPLSWTSRSTRSAALEPGGTPAAAAAAATCRSAGSAGQAGLVGQAGSAGRRRRAAQDGPASASQGSDRSVRGGGGSMAELSDFEHERLLRLWLVAVADRAEDDDAVWAARELLACNQHGHLSGNHLPLRGRRANLSRRLGEG